MKKFVRIIIPICAVAVLIISCINLGSIFLEYNRGVQEYKELQNMSIMNVLSFRPRKRKRTIF